tara:strand:+ start:3882 stop:9800 length:5919 start_codon:yes stop_codon:yes gene_type:complete
VAEDSKELQNQLGIQQQINKVLADRQKILAQQAQQISSQTKMYIEMCNAMNCEDLDGISSRLDNIVGSLNQAADSAGKFGDNTNNIDDSKLEESSSLWGKISDNINAGTGAAVGFGSGISKALKGAVVDAQQTAGALNGVLSSLGGIAGSIISMPFKMLGGLVDMAASGGGGASEWAKQIEKTRGEFGSLASGEGKAVMDMYSNMTDAGGALADTGISMKKIFGSKAEALAFVGDMAKAAGAEFSMLKDVFVENAAQMGAMNKGLGMSNEALTALAKNAKFAGKDVGGSLHAITSMSLDMADQFGVSAKTIGKNVSAMAEDIENFGNMSEKQLVATATYMAKLGLEAKDLQGVIGKFDDFESAADSVSHLNQAFGIQLDTMEMMNAENPAERIDMMRDAFHSAGKSVEDMTRQEKALLAEQTGLSVSAMENAFAQENMGTSYEDIEAAAGEAEENQMSQEEAMSKLADSIEKTFGGGGNTINGFFDALTKGFMKGLTQSEEFKAVMKQIRAAMKVVYDFGKALGSMFSELMGDLGAWDAIKDLFDLGDLKALLGVPDGKSGILGIFRKMKDALTGKGNYSPQQLADDMGKEFAKFFDAKGPAISKLKDAFFKAIEMIGTLITGLIPWVVSKVIDMLKSMAESIRNPPDMGGGGFLNNMITMFSDMFDKLIELAPELLAAILDLLSAVFEKHGGTIMKFGSIYLGIIFTKMMITAALSSLKGAIIGKIAGMFTKSTKQVAKKIEPPDPPPGGEKGGFVDGLKDFVKSFKDLKVKDIMEAGMKMALLAASFIPAMVVMAVGLIVVAMILGTVPFMSLIKALIGTVGAVYAMKMMMEVSQTIKKGTIGKAMVGAIMGAAFLAVGMVAFALAMGLAAAAVNMVGLGNIVKVAIAMAFTAMAALALAAMVIPMALLVADGGTTVGFAFLGAILGAAFLAVGLVGFSLAMGLAAKAVNKTGLANFAVVAAAMVFTAIAAVALTVAAIALALGIVAYPLGAVGAVLSAVLFLAMGTVMLPAMSKFYGAMAGIGFGEIAITLGSLVLIAGSLLLTGIIMTMGIVAFAGGAIGALVAVLFFMALIPMVQKIGELAAVMDPAAMKTVALGMLSMVPILVAAMVAGILLTLAAIPMAIGLVVLALGIPAAFMDALAEDFMPSVEAAGKAMPSGMDQIGKDFERLSFVFLATVIMAAAATGMVIFLLPWIKKMAMKGFKVTGELMMAIVEHFGPAITAIGSMKVEDPAKIEAIVTAIAKIMEAVGGSVDIVAKIALLEAFSQASGGEGGLLEGAKDFMDSIFDGVTGLIKTLAKVVKNMKEGDIKKLEAIGGVIGAIGQLMVALQPPPELFEMLQSMSGGTIGGLLGMSSGVDIKGIMGSYGEVVGDILSAVETSIVSMVESLMGIDIGDNPDAAKAKAEVIGLMVKAAVDMGTGFGELAAGVMALNAEQQPLFGSGPTVADTMGQYSDVLDMIFEAVGAGIPTIVEALMGAAATITEDPATLKPKMEIIALSMSAISDFAGAISSMSGQIPEPGWFESSEDVLEEFLNTVDAIIGIAVDWIPYIVTSLLSADIQGGEAGLQKMEIIANAMDAISTFGDVLGQWSPGWSAEEIYNTYGPIIKGIAWLLGYESDGVGKTFPELMQTIDAMYTSDTIKGKMTQMIAAMESMGEMGATLSALPDVSAAQAKVEALAVLLGPVTSTTGWVPWLLTGVGEFQVPGNLQQSLDAIAEGMAKVADMANTSIASLSISDAALDIVITTAYVILAIGMMFNLLGEIEFPDPAAKVNGMATGLMAMIPMMASLAVLGGAVKEEFFETIRALEEIFSPTSDGFLGLFGGKPSLDGLFQTIEDMNFTPDAIARVLAIADGTSAIVQTILNMMGIAAMMDAMGSEVIQGMVESVVESISYLEEVGLAFEALPEISLQAAVDNFAQAIALETSQFTVTQGPLNIIINLEVSMDAQKVGKVLTNKSVMTTPLATVGEGG